MITDLARVGRAHRGPAYTWAPGLAATGSAPRTTTNGAPCCTFAADKTTSTTNGRRPPGPRCELPRSFTCIAKCGKLATARHDVVQLLASNGMRPQTLPSRSGLWEPHYLRQP